MEGESIMRAAGIIVCFNCQGKKLNLNGNKYPLKKLEVWRKGNNPKSKSKGTLIAWAWVCSQCESEGHNRVPFDGFTGEMRYAPPQLKPEMMEFLQKQKEEAEKKQEEQKAAYPTKKD